MGKDVTTSFSWVFWRVVGPQTAAKPASFYTQHSPKYCESPLCACIWRVQDWSLPSESFFHSEHTSRTVSGELLPANSGWQHEFWEMCEKVGVWECMWKWCAGSVVVLYLDISGWHTHTHVCTRTHPPTHPPTHKWKKKLVYPLDNPHRDCRHIFVCQSLEEKKERL